MKPEDRISRARSPELWQAICDGRFGDATYLMAEGPISFSGRAWELCGALDVILCNSGSVGGAIGVIARAAIIDLVDPAPCCGVVIGPATLELIEPAE